MHARDATFMLPVASLRRRSITLDLIVPAPGGTVTLRGPGDVAVGSHAVSAGPQRVSYSWEPRPPLSLERVRFRLSWAPDSTMPTFPQLIVQGIRVETPPGERPLASVTWDSLGGCQLGPGCAIDVFLQPLSDASIAGTAHGRGTLNVIVTTDSTEPSVVRSVECRDDSVSLEASLQPWENASVLKVRFQASTNAEILTLHDVRFANARLSPYGIADERPDWSPPRASSRKPPMSVVLYVVDTVRRDHLQIYGYEKPTTPGLEAQIEDWLVWENCQSLSSWTKPSVASLLTGLDPIVHGANTDEDHVSPQAVFLWEGLHDAGFETAFFTTNGHTSETWGFSRGIDHFAHFPASPLRRGFTLCADSLHLAFLRWLGSRPDPDRPFFAFLHAMDPHAPYAPDPSLLSNFYPPHTPKIAEASAEYVNGLNCPLQSYEPWQPRALSALYDAEIAGWDRAFCSFIDRMRTSGVLEHTAIVLVSDHGEEFADHRMFSHGFTLYREQLEVPMLALIPRCPGTRSDVPLDLRDVGSLVYWITGGKPGVDWTPPTRSLRPAFLSRGDRQRARAQSDESTVIWNISPMRSCDQIAPEFEVFADDPLEQSSVTWRRRVTAEALRGAFSNWYQKRLQATRISTPLDSDTKAMLRLLGYLSDDSASVEPIMEESPH